MCRIITLLQVVAILLQTQMPSVSAFNGPINRNVSIAETSASAFLPKRNYQKKRVHANVRSNLNMLETPFQLIAQAYSSSLTDHPFVTKGVTGFCLCGVGDIIAQVRGSKKSAAAEQSNANTITSTIDKIRLAKFATKGFYGTSIWAVWYNFSESLINNESILSILSSMGIVSTYVDDAFVNLVRTLSVMTAEQFIACPIVYGLWEIPASTLLNGAPISRIPYEIKDKLVDMLIQNAKVWTFANFLIYNVPVDYRTGAANLGDIVWQTIVSDFSADCGTDNEKKLEAIAK
jgi:hypothetical protein